MNDKYIIPVFISGTILLMLFVFFIVAYLLVQKQKQNAYHIEKTKMIFDHQNKLLTARFDEQERTMAQMSREIHDNVGQLLTFAKMNLGAIFKAATDERQSVLIKNTQGLLAQVSADVRNISHMLNSDFIKEVGLVKVLNDELECINLVQSISCRVDIEGRTETFDPGKELLIYRVAQEAIHNITKHAKASEICITLHYGPTAFTMNITDNGKGFDRKKIYDLNGIGFQNMLERATLLKGSLEVESQPSQGCTIILRATPEHLRMSDKIMGQEFPGAAPIS